MVKLPFEKKTSTPSVDIEKLIEKGAPVKEEIKKKEDLKKHVVINLRMPVALLEEIDQKVDGIIGISRTGWILQALQKILKNETN